MMFFSIKLVTIIIITFVFINGVMPFQPTNYNYKNNHHYKYNSQSTTTTKTATRLIIDHTSTLTILKSTTNNNNEKKINNYHQDNAWIQEYNLIEYPDYFVTGSEHLSKTNRPTWKQYIQTFPNEFVLRFPLIIIGFIISYYNVIGNYDNNNNGLYSQLVIVSVVLAYLNTLVDYWYANSATIMSKNIRRGAIDHKTVQLYISTYTPCVAWLTLRVYTPICPSWLLQYDGLLGSISTLVFLGSLVSPILSLASNNSLTKTDDRDNNNNNNKNENSLLEFTQVVLARIVRLNNSIEYIPLFSPIEQYRCTALVGNGFIASLYVPVALYLAVFGNDWWTLTLQEFPQQGLLESSTALFGLFAIQANTFLNGAAKFGVRPMQELVPAGLMTTLLLAVLPCGCCLYYLRQDITFFQHYTFTSF